MGKPDQPRNPDGTWKARNSWGLAGLVALTVAIGAGAGGVGAGAVGGATGGAGTSVGRSGGNTQAKARARDRSTLRTVQRLQSRGLQVTERAVDAGDDCAANSYGQVQEFFRQNACAALYRALFEVRDGQAMALVAVAWVDMPNEAQAMRYQQLVDRHGTGNVTELSTRVQWTGQRYVSTRDGVTVVNAQAEPVGRTAAAVALAQLAAGAAAS